MTEVLYGKHNHPFFLCKCDNILAQISILSCPRILYCISWMAGDIKSISSSLPRSLRHLTAQVVWQWQNEFYKTFPILKIKNLQTKEFCCFSFFYTLFIASNLYFHHNYKIYKIWFIKFYSQLTGYYLMAAMIRFISIHATEKETNKLKFCGTVSYKKK